MSRKRINRAMAAIGGLTAAVALLSVPSAANADELADLRANQELLQRRLDQLAQIPAPAGVYPGGPPVATAGAGIVGGSFPRSSIDSLSSSKPNVLMCVVNDGVREPRARISCSTCSTS